jgi:predicted Zn-dependent peptidase
MIQIKQKMLIAPVVAFKIFLICLCLCQFAFQARAYDPKVDELSKKKMPKIEEPEISIKKLDNGMTVYYLQDAELPLFKLSTFFENGSAYDTESERGIASFFMSTWRGGGSRTIPADKVDETMEFFAAQMSASAGFELSTFDVVCLQKDAKEILDVYFKLLREPAFQKDRIEIIRKGDLNAIQRRNEERMPIAMREFRQSLYGEKSPHAWYSTPETIQSFTPEVLRAYYAKNIGTNRMWLAATSPLSFDDFLATLDPYIKDWKTSVKPKKFPTQIEKIWDPSAEFIPAPASSSTFTMAP